MKKEKIVLPGDEVAVAEEYLAGEGTYDYEGKILASSVGTVELDKERMIAKVKPFNPPIKLRRSDVVIAVVTDMRGSLGTAEVLMVEGKERGISGNKIGSIHVSKISQSYTSDVREAFRIGDIIRATVIQTKPSLQLSTSGSKFGVLRALCTRCRAPLVLRGKSLFCPRCKRTESRKIASDYASA